MPKVQSRLTLALLFTALVMLAFFGTAFLSSAIDFMYRNASGLVTARNIAQIVALLGVVGLLIAGLIVAIPTALQPGNFGRKLIYAIPLFLILFTIMGIVSALIGVGQTGTLVNIQGVGSLTFAAGWLAVAAILTPIAVIIAAARAKLGVSVLRPALLTLGFTDALGLIATVAMLASVAIVATSQPSTGFGGPGGGGFPGGGRPGQGQGQRPESTIEAPAGFAAPGQSAGGQNSGAPGQQPEATLEAPAGFSNPGSAPAGNPGQRPEATADASSSQNGGNTPGGFPTQGGQAGQGGGFPGGQGGQAGGFPGGGFPPPGGGPGGPGNFANAGRDFEIGGALMAVFMVVALFAEIGGLRAVRAQTASSAASAPTVPNDQREAGSAVLALIGVAVIVGGLIQLVPVAHDNPPVQSAINWDSQQTKDLAYRACMNCHSNETTWPFYAYIAPMSWLTSIHVHDARAMMNLSELDNMPSFQRSNIANNMAMQLRAGTMPPADYLLLHPEARLSDTEKQQLIQGLQATFGS